MSKRYALLLAMLSASCAVAGDATNLWHTNWSFPVVSNYCAVATNGVYGVAVKHDIERVIRNVEATKQTEELVAALAKSGAICLVYGHQWRGGRPGEENGVIFADYHPGTAFRTCKICGNCQSKSEEWE